MLEAQRGVCAFFGVMFKYKRCVNTGMKKEKSLYEDKKVQKLIQEIKEANKDPKFRNAIKEFIRLTTGH